MRPGFDLDGGAATGGAFFLCTEEWPRCFVIKQVSDVDGALKEVQQKHHPHPPHPHQQQSSTTMMPLANHAAAGGQKMPPQVVGMEEASSSASSAASSSSASASSPYLPMLPWWFTAECRQQLLAVAGPEAELLLARALTPETRPPSSIGGGPMSQEQLRARLSRQLEYYFSRENLINDRYLRCQMDADQYVPIKIVANFPKVAQLTTDFGLIVDVLRASSQVQVDESGTKVRPVSKRCTIILREIPANADENEVKAMFQSERCPPYQSLAYGLNDSWYVTFGTEEDTQQAFFHLQTLGTTFNGKPFFARIKTGGAPIGADMHARHSPDKLIRLLDGTNLRGQLIVHEAAAFIVGDRTTPSPQPQNGGGGEQNGGGDGAGGGNSPAFNLGQLLAKFGYVPRATFRPHIPAPSGPMMPPLQPVGTMANGLPQPTSYFAQPILHNGGFLDERLHLRHYPRPPLHHFPFGHPARRPSRPLAITAPGPETAPYFYANAINGGGNETEEEWQQYQGEQYEVKEEQEDDRTEKGEEEEMEEGAEDGAEFSANGYGCECPQHDEEEDGCQGCATGCCHRCCCCSCGDDCGSSIETASHPATTTTVGQNEFVLRQQAKEGGGVASPVLVPKEVPRITDVPRMNGKGGAGGVHHHPHGHCGNQRKCSADRQHSPPLTSGAGFVGFQRQESVEAYQMAVAANGVGKQRKQAAAREEKEEEKNGGPVAATGAGRCLNKAMGSGRGSLPKSATCGRTTSSDQAPPRILGSHGPRRSEPAAPPLPSSTPFRPPPNESASSASANWRQPAAKQQPQQQQSPPTTAPSAMPSPNPVAFSDFRGMPPWQNGLPNASGIQPLLSLGQIQPVAHQSAPQQQQHSNPTHTMHQGQPQQQLAPFNGAPGKGANYDNRKPTGRDTPFRGGGGGGAGGNGPTGGYRARTWTNDWPRGGHQQACGHYAAQREGGGPHGGGGQFQQQQERGNWSMRGGRGGGPPPSRGPRRNGGGGDWGGHEPVEEAKHQQNGTIVESHQQREQRQFAHQYQQRPPPHFVVVPPHFRHEQRQRSNTTAGPPFHPQFREPSDCSSESGGPRGNPQQGWQKQQMLKCGEAGYNFEEHVEEFPALNLSQSNSRKSSECHGDQQQSPLLLPTVPEPAEKCAESEGGGGEGNGAWTSIAPTAADHQHHKKPFSAVVAGGRPRRATIGTTMGAAAIGGVGIGTARKGGEGGGGKLLLGDGLVAIAGKQLRSGTISAGTTTIQQCGGGQRSYAQMLKSGPPKSTSASDKDGGSSCAGTDV